MKTYLSESVTINTAAPLGQLGKKRRPCQMHSSPASVTFITYGFDGFVKVIECEMCILKLYWNLPSTVVQSLPSLKQID